MLLMQVLSAEAAKFKVVYNFRGGNDGAQPQSDLIAIGKKLYGTTVEGGSSNAGTLFSLNPKTGVETVLHSFGSAGDGAYPMAAVVRVGSQIYGTTVSGGNTDYGSVYSYDLRNGAEKVVYSFQSGEADGDTPQASLIEMGGMLYGTTYTGGSSSGCNFGCGTIYSIDPETNLEKVVHLFQTNDGVNPNAALTKAGGKLYGTTTEGGDGNCGTAFVFDPATKVLSVVHEFDHQVMAQRRFPA
ncbi:MAG: choice-of-anchor tandem repeat GloVer-containing protein [Rhizomicrobium sp.]